MMRNCVHARGAQTLDDMLEDRFAAHRDHRLGQLVRQFAHARAAAGGEENRFRDDVLMMRGVRFVFGRAIRSVAAFELNRGVLDPEALVQFMRDRLEQLIVELRFAFHDMRGAGRLGRAQAPDVEVMDLGDAGQLFEKSFHRARIDPARDGVEHEIDRVAQQSPGADENDRPR